MHYIHHRYLLEPGKGEEVGGNREVARWGANAIEGGIPPWQGLGGLLEQEGIRTR